MYPKLPDLRDQAACRYYGGESLLDFIQSAARGPIGIQDEDGYIGPDTESAFVESDN